MVVIGTRNVARATGAGAALIDGGLHRVAHDLVLTHAEIVVRAPDRDFVGRVIVIAFGLWKLAAAALQLGKDAIIALIPQSVELCCEHGIKIHRVPPVLLSFE